MQLRRKFSRRAASVPAVARNDIHRSGDRRESVQGLAPTAIKSTQPIRLRPLDSSVFASLLTFAGVSAAILFASTYRTAIPAIAIPASLLAAAVLAALVSAYARPLPLRQVAMTLDLRLDLRERLSTALELMGGQGNRRRRGQTPVSPIRVRTRTRSASVPLAAPALAEVIFVQAVSRSRQAGVDQLRFHAVGRPALGAMGLSLLLAAAMLALPGGEPKTFDSADDILAVFPNLPENRRVDLAQELARAAAGAQTRQQQQSLNQAADAASRNDLESLREALDRIKEGIAKGLLKIVRVGPAPGERLADDTSPPTPSQTRTRRTPPPRQIPRRPSSRPHRWNWYTIVSMIASPATTMPRQMTADRSRAARTSRSTPPGGRPSPRQTSRSAPATSRQGASNWSRIFSRRTTRQTTRMRGNRPGRVT